MKLVKQSYEILEQEIPVCKMDDYSGSHFREQYIQNMYKHIELCGRTCYRSEDRITEGNAERFVKGLIKTKHYSVLEHGAIYLRYVYNPNDAESKKFIGKYFFNPYSKQKSRILESTDLNKPISEQKIGEHIKVSKAIAYISTSYRVIIENGWEEDLQYLCEPTEYHEKRHTVLLHSCIHVYKDLTRHRKMSFSIESTRYCNYTKIDKFGEMKFVTPPWGDFGKTKNLGTTSAITEQDYIALLYNIENVYNSLIQNGWKQEQAAEILPQCTAADVVMSGFARDWEFVFRLRSDTAETGKPHPLVEEIMTPLRDEFVINKYIQL